MLYPRVLGCMNLNKSLQFIIQLVFNKLLYHHSGKPSNYFVLSHLNLVASCSSKTMGRWPDSVFRLYSYWNAQIVILSQSNCIIWISSYIFSEKSNIMNNEMLTGVIYQNDLWRLYHTERKFTLEFKIRYFPDGRFAKFKFCYYHIFRNLSMIAYIIYDWNLKIKVLRSENSSNLSQVCKLNFVYTFIL